MLAHPSIRTLLVAAVVCCAGSGPAQRLTAKQPLRYNRDVRPLLSNNCFFCHGPDAAHREAGLRLDVEEDAKEWAILPGDPAASELVARITTDDPAMVMPPPESGKQLSPEDIATLKRWVAEGAEYEPYWAYLPPRQASIPTTRTPIAATGPIDSFLAATWERLQITPAAPADPATLMRRLHFDLTGLPPAPEVVERFAADPSEAHYRKIVDRLLADPAFGERMAIYWLDLVRYADTVGYHGDQTHNISPYRDYVIDSLNAGLPLDRFTREQLAGDLLENPSIAQRVATGYNRLLQTSHEGGVQPKEYLAIYAADRVRNVSAVWMGATVGCAECHDHKYDPYTARDFYRLAAFFADVDEAQHFRNGTNSLPTRRSPEIRVFDDSVRQRIAEIDRELELLRADPADETGPESSARRESLAAERKALEATGRLTMVTESIKPRTMRVLPRGNWLDDSGEVVTPDVPEFLGTVASGAERPSRLDLANWLVDAESGVGGLTARVFANRFWYLFFGRGLTPSLDDFGGQGQPPDHPELLDHLALQFLRDDWDIKRFVRRLVISQAYRKASTATADQLAADLENRWFARQSRYRLPAEMVRDNALAVSGLLVRQVGGRSVRPFQPAGYYRHLNFPKRKYQADQGAPQWRRGVYVHWQRQFLHPMLKAMDAPSREECTAARPRSNTPLEALVLLNDPTFLRTAVALAERGQRELPDATSAERIAWLFQQAVSRRPDAAEANALARLLEAEIETFAQDQERTSKFLQSLGKDAARVPDPVELAGWTSLARAVLNLNETVARN